MAPKTKKAATPALKFTYKGMFIISINSCLWSFNC